MATEQYITQRVLQNQPVEDETEKWKSSSGGTDSNSSGGFDCNICLESVQDPVVTLCGHLYCWPCIYKWIHQQSISPEVPKDQEPLCPVCKAEVSESTLIPLYGRGQSMMGKPTNFGPVIPCRPKGPPCGVHTLVSTSTTRTSQQPAQRDTHHHHSYPPYQPYYGGYDYTSAPGISLAGTTTFHPMISMFGEMICARFFGNSQSFYTYPDSYSVAATSSARAWRHVVQADRSLSRLSFFLCCCLVLCLVFF